MIYVVITPFFPLPGHWWGGYVYDQVNAIIKNGAFDQVIILRAMPINDCYDYNCNGLRVYGLPFLEMPTNLLTGNAFQKMINNKLLDKTFKRIGIRYEDISYIHMHTYQTSILTPHIKKKNPHIYLMLQHHDLNPFGIAYGKYSDKRWNINYIGRKIISYYKDIDLHICISNATRDNLILFPEIRNGEIHDDYIKKVRKYSGPKPLIKNTYVLHNGVDPQLFYCEKNIKNNNVYTVGCVGGFSLIKNQITLIKAIEYIVDKVDKNIILRFIGTGSEKQLCQEYVKNHHLENYINFEANREHHELREFYNSIDLFCLPSYFEGFGCVYTEAYACGTPFIACKYQGAEDMISSDQKEIFLLDNPFDYHELASKILNIRDSGIKEDLALDYDINLLISDFINYILSQK